MPRHQRRFSDSLVLEEDGKGSVLVSRINPDLSASQGLHEGDKIVGATIHFDHLTKNEVAEILKLIEPYDDKVQMLAKQDKGWSKSKSLESLDRIKAPDEMLKDSYQKLYNARVKKFFKENPDGRSQEKTTSSLNRQKAAHVLSHDKTKNDSSNLPPNDLPTVDFRNQKVDVAACLQKVERREKSLKTLQSVDNFGPLECQNYITDTGTPEVCKNDMKTLPNTSVVLQKGNMDITTNMSDSITRPDLGPHTYNKTPNMKFVGTMTDFDPDVNKPSPDGRTDVPVGKFLKKSKSKANAHGVSEHEYNFDPLKQSASLGQRDEVRVPEFGEYNSDLVSGQSMMEQGRVKAPQHDMDTTSKHNYSPEFLLQSLKKTPDIDINSPKGKLKMPNQNLPDFKSPEIDVKGDLQRPELRMSSPNLDSDISAPHIEMNENKIHLKGPKKGLLGPKAKLSDIDLSSLQTKGEINSPDLIDPELNLGIHTERIKGRTETPNMDLSLSKPDFEGPNLNVKSLDMDIDGPSGKMKMPNFKIPTFGHPKDITPEMDISAPTFTGDINSPEFKIKGHKPNVRVPELDADMHSGKLKMPTLEKPNFDFYSPEFDTDANTGKLKMPKFGFSGNLPKSPDLKGPKFKGGINGKDTNLTLPESDLKTPNLDYNSPDIGFEGSAGKLKTPKFKTPKFGIPGFKGPKTDIKGDLKHPDLSLSSPELDGEISAPDMNIDGPNFKSSKGGLNLPDINLPSGNVKMPKLKTPHLGLSGPNVKAPEMDLSPGMIKGEINSPDFTDPDLNIDIPTGKIKGSTLKTPNLDIKAPEFDTDVPTGKLKMPKFGISSKGPNLKGPKIKGGIDTPNMDLNLSKPDFEGPNLNVKSPDMDIDGPSGKMKMPTFKIPTLGHSKVKTPDMYISAPTFKGDINSPDFNIKGHKPNFTAPELDADIHAGKIKMPTFEKPNFDINAPELNTGKLKMPKFGLSGNLPKSPDLKGPKFKGGISGKDVNLTLPESDLKTPNLDYNSPDIGIEGSAGKFKAPKFKTPKFSIPGFKGPKTDIKGDLKHPDLSLSSPELDGEISAPDMNIDGPNLKSSKGGLTLPDINLPSGNVKMPKLKTPHLGLSGPNVKAPEMDLSPGMIKGEINSPDFTGPDANIDIPTGKIKGSTLKTPNLDIKTPEFDTDFPTGKLKMPKFGFSSKGPNLKGPKIKGGIDTPNMDLNLSKPDFEGPNLNVKSPDMDIDGPSGKMKMPTFKIPTLGHSKVKTPDMDISAPTFKGDINSPDFNIKGHKPNFTAPELDADIHAGKMKMPTFEKPNFDINAPELNTGKLKMPKFGLSGNLPKSPDLKGPKFKGGISGKDVNLTLPESDLKTPNLDYNSPDIGIEGSAGKFKAPKFKTPKFSIPGFKGPKTDIKGDLKHPDLSLSSPELDGEISAPDMNIDGPNLKSSKGGLTLPDINLPSGNVKMPKLKTPHLGLSGPNVKAPEMDLSPGMIKGEINSPDFTGPDANIDIPTGKIKGSTLKTPNLDIKTPEFDTDFPTGKLKMPKFGFSSKGPNLKGPKIKGGIDTPNMDLNLSKPDFEGPNLNVKSPDMDIDGPSGKMKMPTFKIPTLGHSKVKTPDMDISAPTFKGDINSPDFNIKGHKPNFTAPELDADIHAGKMKMPTSEKPNFDINAPELNTGKLKMPKFGLSGNLPKSPDLKGPKFKGGISGKDVNLTLPESDLKTPNLDYNSPDIGIEGSAGKFKAPKFKTPKFSIPGFKGPKTDIKGDLKHPDLNLSSPRLDGEISAPGMNIDGPKFKSSKGGLTLPDINLPSGNVKMPKLKTPHLGLSGPNVKAPEMDLSPGMIKGEINSPDFTGPDANIDIPTGKIKGSTLKTPNLDIKTLEFDTDVPTGKLKMPKFGFSGHLPKGPNLKGPKIKGGIDTPNMDLNLSKPDFEGPNLNVKSPDMDIDGPSGKMKMPTFKIPTLGHSKVKTPDMDISAPTFKGDINSPDFNIKGHKPNFTAPELDADIHAGKMKMPTFEKPNFDINAPELNTGKLKMPKFGLSGNLPKSPDLKGPKFKGGISGKDVNLTLPESDLKTPNLDYNSPDIGIEGSAGKFKAPKFKTPKFSIPGFKGPKTDIKGDLKHPDLNLSSPRLDGEISAPDMNIDGPKFKSSKGGLTLPDINLPSGNVKMPKLKTPHLGLSGPNVKAPEMDLSPGMIKGEINSPDFTGPDVNIDIPMGKIKGSTLKTPNLDIKAPEFDTDVPTGKLKMPKFGFSGKGPNLKGPKIKGGIDTPNMDLNLSKPDFEGPNLNVKSPDMDIDGPSGKMKMPTFKIPTLGHSKVKTPDMDISAPTFKGDINSPDFNIKGHKPNFTAPELDADIHAGKMKMPTFEKPNFDINAPELNTGKMKMPKFGLSGNLPKSPDLKGPKFKGGISGKDINLTLPESDLKTPNLDYNSPDIGIEGSGVNIKKPKFKTPKFSIPGFKGPKTDIKGDLTHPDLNLSSPNLDAEIYTPDIDIDGPKAGLKGSKAGLTLPDMDLPSSKIRMPKGPNIKAPNVKGVSDVPDMNLKFPEANMRGPKLDVKSPDIDIDGPDGKLNMPRLKAPKISIPGFKDPNVNVKRDSLGTDLNLSSPKLNADLSGQDISFDGPKANLQGFKSDLNLPDMDFPSGKVNMPKFKMPDFGLSGPNIKVPEMDTSPPTMKGEFNANAALGKVRLPESSLSGSLPKGTYNVMGGSDSPGMNLQFPESHMKRPELDVKSPETDVNGAGGNFKTPRLKNPKFDIPDFKEHDPEVKGNLVLSSPKFDTGVRAPEFDTRADLKRPKTDHTLADTDLSFSKLDIDSFKVPDLGLSDVKLPNMKARGEINSPGIKFTEPESHDPDIDPNISTTTSKAASSWKKTNGSIKLTKDLDSLVSDLDLDVPQGTLKKSKFKLLTIV